MTASANKTTQSPSTSPERLPWETSETTENSSTTTSNASTPWSGRTLNITDQLIREYKAAYEAYKAAEGRWKQVQGVLRDTHAEGLLEPHKDKLSGVYQFDGVHFKEATTTTWPISGFSDELQALHAKEKDDGTATPKVSKSLRAKWVD